MNRPHAPMEGKGVRCFSPQVCIAFFSQSLMRAEAPHYFLSDPLNVTASKFCDRDDGGRYRAQGGGVFSTKT